MRTPRVASTNALIACCRATMTSPFPSAMNAGTPFTGMSPRYTANTPIAPSPAPSAASSLPINAERDLSTAISRLVDENSVVCLATLQKEYEEYWAGLKSFDQRVFNAPGESTLLDLFHS